MFYDCARCGRTCIPEGTFNKCIERGYPARCADCRAGRLIRVQYGEDYCVPHQGVFDLNDYPLDNAGRRLFESEALCGHRDCIKDAHYATPKLVKFAATRSRGEKPRKHYYKPTGNPRGRPKTIKGTKHFDRIQNQQDINIILATAEVQAFNKQKKAS